MIHLEEDMDKLVNDVAAENDFKVALTIMSKTSGLITVFGTIIASLTVWLPNVGFP